MKYVYFFEEADGKRVDLFGGKGASLALMTAGGLPVPPGFNVTAETFHKFIVDTGIEKEIYAILRNLDVHNSDELNSATKQIRKIISPLMNYPLDILVYERDEFYERARLNSTLEHTISEEGVRVYG